MCVREKLDNTKRAQSEPRHGEILKLALTFFVCATVCCMRHVACGMLRVAFGANCCNRKLAALHAPHDRPQKIKDNAAGCGRYNSNSCCCNNNNSNSINSCCCCFSLRIKTFDAVLSFFCLSIFIFCFHLSFIQDIQHSFWLFRVCFFCCCCCFGCCCCCCCIFCSQVAEFIPL